MGFAQLHQIEPFKRMESEQGSQASSSASAHESLPSLSHYALTGNFGRVYEIDTLLSSGLLK